MSWEEEIKFRFRLGTVILAVMSPVFCVMSAAKWFEESRSNRWPSVPGQVKVVVALPTWDQESEQNLFVGKATYAYVVDGKEYASDRRDMGPQPKRQTESHALADVRDYQVGMDVQVRYDPHNPSEAVLHPGGSAVARNLAVATGIVTIVCWIASFFILRRWLLLWRHPG